MQRSEFDRKHYSYADLPHGFQITQQRRPVVCGGSVPLSRGGGAHVRIERVQLEMDSGKSLHDLLPGRTAIDLNRAGAALLEIVTLPDIRCPEDAADFVRCLQSLLRHVGVCDGNMERGSLRVDVNVSVRRADAPPGEPFGQRVEVKNLNSLRSVARAVEHEVERQSSLLEDPRRPTVIPRETRGFDAAAGVTTPLRRKESAVDYRFMPEPDLPPLIIPSEFIEHVRATMPELPDQTLARVIGSYALGEQTARLLITEPGGVAFLEEAVAAMDGPPETLHARAHTVANWMASELFSLLRESKRELGQSPVRPAQLARLLSLVSDGVVSARAAKQLLPIVYAGECGGDPRDAAEKYGLLQMNDDASLRSMCEAALRGDKAEATLRQYLAGRDRLFASFVGAVMKASGGKASPTRATEILKELIEQRRQQHKM